MITFSQLGKFGRIGNMLFQCSSTIGIAKTLGQDYAFPEWEYQSYFEKPLPKLPSPLPKFTAVLETGYHFKSYVGHTAENIDLFGYLQSPLYWSGHEDEVKSYFKLSQSAFHTVFENWLGIVKQIPPRKKLETIGLHVRRCDYIGRETHHTDLASTKYYDLAIRKMQELLGYTDIDIVVFSDDIDFVKEYFKDRQRIYYAPINDPVTDLFTLSLMDHHIIANSSFSWWSGYLSGNKSGHIVSPGNLVPWFGPAYDQNEYDVRDLCPKEWHLI